MKRFLVFLCFFNCFAMHDQSDSSRLENEIATKESFLEGATQLLLIIEREGLATQDKSFVAGMNWVIKSIKEKQTPHQQGQFLDAMEKKLQAKKRKRDQIIYLLNKFEPRKQTKKDTGADCLSSTQEK